MMRKLTTARVTLRQLGMERETPEKQLLYLTDLATQFQRLVSLSVDAKYGNDGIFDDMGLRLATLVSKRNATFSDDLAHRGQEYRFGNPEDSVGVEGDSTSIDEDPSPAPSSESIDSVSSSRGVTFQVRKMANCDDIEDILYAQENLSAANENPIHLWLRQVYQRSRGFELGTFNSSILSTTMKSQSAKWPSLALGYISDIVVIVHKFIHGVLELICPERLVKSELLSVLSDGLFERYEKAINQIHFLLQVERTGTPLTLNHYFNENLEKW